MVVMKVEDSQQFVNKNNEQLRGFFYFYDIHLNSETLGNSNV